MSDSTAVARNIVGREEELDRIAAFVAASRDGPAALVVEGEPGIGKTTLWRYGTRLFEAADLRVLKTTPAASEASLPLSALTDLLEPVYHLVRVELPPPQRRALDTAFALADSSDPDSYNERLLRTAALSMLRALARLGPIGIAVDDCQWIDHESSAALIYALRRLDVEPVICLFARRHQASTAFDLAQLDDVSVERIEVGPLSLGATQRLLLEELGVTFPRPIVRRLVETSGGNPFYAIELARGLERKGDVRADEPLVLSQTLDALIAARFEGLPERSRRLLGFMTLLPSATIQLLVALDVADDLDGVVAADLVEVEQGTVRFAHPLLAAGAYARLGPEERRGLHAALASAVDDPVERAGHLARSTVTESAEIANELVRTASMAAGRALPGVAAKLAEEAARLTPASDTRGRMGRRLLAARFHARAGAFERAGELLLDVTPQLPPGEERADALRLQAQVAPDIGPQRAFLERALEETDDPAITSEIYALLVRNHLYADDLADALAAARAADAHAQQTGDPRQMAAGTTIRGLMEIWGTGAPDPDVYERARTYARSSQKLPVDTYSNPHTLLGVRGLYRYEIDGARAAYAVAVAAAEAEGDIDSLETYWWGLAQLEVRAGRYPDAAAHVEMLRVSQESHDRQPMSRSWIEGVVATYEGREPDARVALEETIERAEAEKHWFFVAYGRAALGFLELSIGDARSAVEALEPVLSSPFVLEGDPGQTGILPTAAEAMVMTGDLTRASEVMAHLEQRGRELEHPWCLASAGRCRGLLLAEGHDFVGASNAFREALALHDEVPAPFERARTLLALGSTQRRAKQRRAARESLEAALTVFDELGAPLWSSKARGDLERIRGRASTRGDLTANELRIATLVGEGKTNKEVAAVLFVSDRTVESALTQIYRKLDVRSRTELAHKLRVGI